MKKSLVSKFTNTLQSDDDHIVAFWSAKVIQHSFSRKNLKNSKKRSELIDLNDLESVFGVELDESMKDREKADLFLALSEEILNKQYQSDLKFPKLINRNLSNLQEIMKFNSVEIELVRFLVYLTSYKSLSDITDVFGKLNSRQLIAIFSWILDTSKTALAKALRADSVLSRTGIIRVNLDFVLDFNVKIYFKERIVDLIMTPELKVSDILKEFCIPTKPPELCIDQFPHMQEITQDLIDYLDENRKEGVNILVYGPPGTGKTQWVRLVAELSNQSLYEVSYVDEYGDAVHASRRIEMYEMSQRALQNQKKVLVMFDEVEDVFPGSFVEPSRLSISKARLNAALEHNPVPAFWVSNKVEQIDPAYLRRFDFVVQMDVPPRSVRFQIIKEAVQGMPISESWMRGLAENSSMTPAIIDRCSKVVSKTQRVKNLSPKEVEQKLLEKINSSLSAQGHKEISLKVNQEFSYSLEYINTDTELESLVEGMKNQSSARLCLYGLPGTGKTAFGHYLAEQLDKPVLIKRASDLLSPYIGEAEMNIARAFNEARKEGAVLQIDEADSFLQNRENAQRSWEISQVNELLTQMEAFDGVFIASTNLMDNIDSAAMRRFDFKMEFKPLTKEQAWKMFIELQLGVDNDVEFEELRRGLDQLSSLTPGDFAVVKRKISLMSKLSTPKKVLDLLTEECRFKPNITRRGIGFMS